MIFAYSCLCSFHMLGSSTSCVALYVSAGIIIITIIIITMIMIIIMIIIMITIMPVAWPCTSALKHMRLDMCWPCD